MKKLTACAAISMSLLLMAGCGKNAAGTTNTAANDTPGTQAMQADSKDTADTAAPAGDEVIYIPVISKGFSQQFWQTVKMGADQAAEELGVTIEFVGPESETMVDKQVEMLEAAMNKNPSAICLAALDSKAMSHLLEKARDQNIPVIGFDSGIDSDIPVTTAATDNYAAAAHLAEQMGEALGGSGKVAVIVTDQVTASSIGRRDGFVETLKEKYPDITVVDILYGEGDPLKSTDLVKACLQAHADITGFVGLNEGSAVGVLNAVEELKKFDEVTIMGFDSGKQQIEAVRSGKMAGAITQNPIGIGYIAVESAVKAIKGETLAKTIDTGFYFYTKDNMDLGEIKPLLYD